MLSMVHPFYAMASDCAAHLCGETAAKMEQLAATAEHEVRKIEARYSRYRSDNQMTRINKVAVAGGSIDIDPETAGLIAYAKACFAKSDGAFDISSGLLRKVWDFSAARCPFKHRLMLYCPLIGLDKVTLSCDRLHFGKAGMELDFGGLGKEYADRAAEVCIGPCARYSSIDLGGDIRVFGPQPDGCPWRIGIRHPRDADKVVAEITLWQGALATSGDYERFLKVDGRRYCHILDARTGWPAYGLASVTVIADRCRVAGSLSTAAMLRGKMQPLGFKAWAFATS
jgi:thiamine biosynthesis lipoprotein